VQTDFLFERRLNDHLFGVIAEFSKGGRCSQCINAQRTEVSHFGNLLSPVILSLSNAAAGKPTLVFCRYARPPVLCMRSQTAAVKWEVRPFGLLYDSALSILSSRKGTCETASHLQKDGQQHASSGAPSAFVHSPAQHRRLQACFLRITQP
jgi:hypothetical protein